MPTDKDLFDEEQQMVAMSFGEHIEELRARLILAILGLFVGVLLTFIPPLSLGWRVMTKMQAPAKGALTSFYKGRAEERAKEALDKQALSPTVEAVIPAEALARAIKQVAPSVELKDASELKDVSVQVPIRHAESGLIRAVQETAEPKEALISLAPLETMTIFFMVCLVTGLVLASPWVFYQIWAFVAAGLYRHERHYVMKYLPYSLGLFLLGVGLCFQWVLPWTLSFLLEFNVWLGIEPTLRLADWMSFATILPLIFGACFQTPMVMLLLERIGVFTAEDYRSKRKIAILLMVIAAAVITPTQDPLSLSLLAVPMIALYELGIFLVGRGTKSQPVHADLA